MSSILFVDDSKNVLWGLRRRLHSTCPEWETAFASSGAEALSLCDQRSFDVIVTDMKMPGMDGGELLKQVQNKFPDTARIILSGFSEDEAILRTLGRAHRYLAKPCDDEMLINSIRQILDVRSLLPDPRIRNSIGNIEALASPPDTYLRLVKALEDPKVDNKTISAIVSSDIALTAEILKLTNSAYFSMPAKITSISHAVRMIGTETLKSITLLMGLFKGFEGPSEVSSRMFTLCHRSQQIGVAASLIAEHEKLDKEVCSLLPATGMLSHVGSLILNLNYYEEMEQVIEIMERKNVSIIDAEKELFGASHPEIGAYLLGLWGFSDPVIEAVAHHHCPSKLAGNEMTGLSALYAAQHLTRELSMPEVEETTIDLSYLKRIGKEGQLQDWYKIVGLVLESYNEGGREEGKS
ncbi:MAG: HDOD domain-containing protein [Rhodospirillales bacterium]|nr:HDOD domain-containing protein [Rhodospirillales bacterium]